MRIFSYIMLICLLTMGLFADTYKVIYVVDGDTVDVINLDKPYDKKIRIRLANIDTMESTKNVRAKKLASKCNIDIEELVKLGSYSKEILKELVLNKNVDIEFKGKDTTGTRVVGIIKLSLTEENINEIMVRDGYGLPYYKYMSKDDKLYYEYLRNRDNPILNNKCVLDFLK